MSAVIIETRVYVDGRRQVRAEILDNGCVQFAHVSGHELAAVSADVLEQLAELARRSAR